ncbi:hypothetical protein A0128_06080 [Leptospira tipperaryensis]|uniref:Uncharacterized protein n=1 Tax=Leptospira tipperaryensis TaxID=2564040 RepID=A0A1D7UV16_9LEPT|nr:hypothetical protein A0128_06080 [Leptospira tipperaryensis]
MKTDFKSVFKVFFETISYVGTRDSTFRYNGGFFFRVLPQFFSSRKTKVGTHTNLLLQKCLSGRILHITSR